MLTLLRKYPLSIIWVLFILVMCSVRMTSIPLSGSIHIPNFDKLVHFGFFFVLSALLFMESTRQQNTSLTRLKVSMVIFLIAAIYGGSIELLQKFVFTYRSAEWFDFLADAAGSICSLILILIFTTAKKTQIENVH